MILGRKWIGDLTDFCTSAPQMEKLRLVQWTISSALAQVPNPMNEHEEINCSKMTCLSDLPTATLSNTMV